MKSLINVAKTDNTEYSVKFIGGGEGKTPFGLSSGLFPRKL